MYFLVTARAIFVAPVHALDFVCQYYLGACRSSHRKLAFQIPTNIPGLTHLVKAALVFANSEAGYFQIPPP